MTDRKQARIFPEHALIGVIALEPLPGSPRYGGSNEAIESQALADADAYIEAGIDSLLLENSFDLPYIRPPIDSASLRVMEHIATRLRQRFDGPIGIQVLEAANEEALEIAARADLDYIRVEGYVFAHVGGAGIIEGCAGRLLRLRRRLEAEHIRVFCDVKKKHCAHALTADLSIEDHIRQAEFFLTDGVIITGAHTGMAPDPEDLRAARRIARVPVWIGSGMTVDNLERFAGLTDAFIVGSAFREGGSFHNRLDRARLQTFVRTFRGLKFEGGAE